MTDTIHRIQSADWEALAASLLEKGYALLPGILDPAQCAALKALYEEPQAFRKTVLMERHGYGLGEYKYFNYPLPELLSSIRAALYLQLAPVANNWMELLDTGLHFPPTHAELLQRCRDNQQHKATPLILRYGAGGYNALHQDLYGEVYFPLQALLLLDAPGKDFTGGEFVLTEQRPRAQSRATVIQPQQGGLLIFTTRFRPVKTSRGYSRVQIRHGVSEIHSGERHTLGIIFHDALS